MFAFAKLSVEKWAMLQYSSACLIILLDAVLGSSTFLLNVHYLSTLKVAVRSLSFQGLPKDGINVFATILHTHPLGKL
jgi:hypothetical protein